MRIMKKIFCEIGKKKVSCKARIDLDAGSMLAVRVGLLKPRGPWQKYSRVQQYVWAPGC